MSPRPDEYSRRQFLTLLGGVGLTPLLNTVLSTEAAWAASDMTVLTGATVIDGTGAPAKANQDIVLVGDRISRVGNPLPVPHTPGVRVVDLRGKYVIPGLCDMHTHGGTDDVFDIPLHIANGVTSVREMWGFPETHVMRDRIESGELLGPRFTIASNLIDGPNSIWAPFATEVTTAEEGRQAARDAKAGDADFIKIYSFLGQEAFDGITSEARRLNLPVAGHAPARLSVPMLIEARMRSFEHLYGMPMATSTLEQEYLRQLNETTLSPTNLLFLRLDRLASMTHDAAKAAALYDRMVRNDAWQCPTLTVLRMFTRSPETLASDPRLKYMPQFVRDFWADYVNRTNTPERIAQQVPFMEFRLEMVRRMAEAGVGILGGTDCDNPYCFAGFSAHEELELLVEAGLSPMRALQVMTGDSARFLHQEHNFGTIRPGRSADLLVLDANPLVDIRNTQRIHAIFVRGRMITAAERTQILANVEAAANSPFVAASSVRAAMPHRGVCRCHGT